MALQESKIIDYYSHAVQLFCSKKLTELSFLLHAIWHDSKDTVEGFGFSFKVGECKHSIILDKDDTIVHCSCKIPWHEFDAADFERLKTQIINESNS